MMQIIETRIQGNEVPNINLTIQMLTGMIDALDQYDAECRIPSALNCPECAPQKPSMISKPGHSLNTASPATNLPSRRLRSCGMLTRFARHHSPRHSAPLPRRSSSACPSRVSISAEPNTGCTTKRQPNSIRPNWLMPGRSLRQKRLLFPLNP